MVATYTKQTISLKDINGLSLSYGKIALYKAMTDIPIKTYQSVGASYVENPWPYILDINGTAPNLYIDTTIPIPLRLNVLDSNDVQQMDFPVDGFDNINQFITGLGISAVTTVTITSPVIPFNYELNVPITYTAIASTSNRPLDILTYLWTFDDGTTANTASYAKTWITTGNHTATITATDTYTTGTATASITMILPLTTVTITSPL